MSGRRAGPARLPIYFSGFAVAKDSEGKAPFRTCSILSFIFLSDSL